MEIFQNINECERDQETRDGERKDRQKKVLKKWEQENLSNFPKHFIYGIKKLPGINGSACGNRSYHWPLMINPGSHSCVYNPLPRSLQAPQSIESCRKDILPDPGVSTERVLQLPL